MKTAQAHVSGCRAGDWTDRVCVAFRTRFKLLLVIAFILDTGCCVKNVQFTLDRCGQIPGSHNSKSVNVPANRDHFIAISKLKRVHHSIKSEFQEVDIPTQEVPIPHLTPFDLEEIRAIWISEPRIPMRASRNINLVRVDGWFWPHESNAKKVEQPLPNEMYELFRWCRKLLQ